MSLTLPPDTITIETDTTFCDGGPGGLGHPRVFLPLNDGKADCPYCSRRFVLANGAKSHGAH